MKGAPFVQAEQTRGVSGPTPSVQKENEYHGGGGRVGRARPPVPVDAADEVVDAQKKTEK